MITNADYIASLIAAVIGGAVLGMLVTAYAMYIADKDFDQKREQEHE